MGKESISPLSGKYFGNSFSVTQEYLAQKERRNHRSKTTTPITIATGAHLRMKACINNRSEN
jgi:hypothetical protein